MEGTPKLPRKSLSLTRLGNKRRNTSPQHKQRLEFQVVTDTNRSPNFEGGMRSPSVISLSSDGGCECTPPHKKINLDDSLDYSPRAMDTSCSPSQMLSQSFAIDSPEVGWRWGQRRKNTGSGDEGTKTPDSAYAADSSFTSASPSYSDYRTRTRSDTWRYRQSYDTQRENQRKALEAEIRKAKKERTDELLKKRCAKLEEQLKGDGKEKKVEPEIPPPAVVTVEKSITPSTSKAANKTKQNTIPIINHLQITTPKSKVSLVNIQRAAAFKCSDSANDYFDDSECDDLLLMATQQVETQIIEATQQAKVSSAKSLVTPQLSKVATNQSKSAKASASAVKPATLQAKPPVPVAHQQANPPQPTKQLVKVAPTTTPNAMKQKLRSSLYMQFLEDDLNDDIFRNLDEVIKDATQSKKPRNSFQRYNSMPVQTATPTKVEIKPAIAVGKSDLSNKQPSSDGILMAGSNAKFKRHVSSNALSPSSTSSRGRQLQLKK